MGDIMPEKCVRMATSQTPSLFGRNLRKLRMSRNLTQSELAGLTGMLQRYISSLETAADANPQYDTLRRLAAALGMPLDEFVRTMESVAD